MQHVGKTGYLQLGFATGGVIFLYETATEWYDLFQELMESVSELGAHHRRRPRRRVARARGERDGATARVFQGG